MEIQFRVTNLTNAAFCISMADQARTGLHFILNPQLNNDYSNQMLSARTEILFS